jgi:hypothetical protein
MLLLSLHTFSQSLQTTVAGGVNIKDENIKAVYDLWKNYLSSNPDTIFDTPYWNDIEKKKYKSYDLLKSEGYLSPSLYALQPNNIVLYIKEMGDEYLIHSMYYWLDDSIVNPLAITDVIAKKEEGKFKLYNYLPYYTSDWKSKKIGIIDYYFHRDYVFDEEQALRADDLLKKLNKLFDLDVKRVSYYIARDCDEIQRMKGFDYVVGMGKTPNLCAFFDVSNNIVYSNSKVGEYHMHELIHVINTKYTNANYLLLMGLSVYTNDKNAHLTKPFIYHALNVQKYLQKNVSLDLTDFENLPQIPGSDLNYFVGALIVDAILEKGGISLLKEALQNTEEEKDLLEFLKNKLRIDKKELNIILKNKFKKIEESNKMNFLINF